MNISFSQEQVTKRDGEFESTIIMKPKGKETVGDYLPLSGSAAKVETGEGRRLRRSNSDKASVKIEYAEPGNGISGQKQEEKKEGSINNYEQQKTLITRSITSDAMKIKLTTFANQNDNEEFIIENQPFTPEDLWDPERPFKKQRDIGSIENPMNIPSLLPLPEKNHVLNKPQQYHPIGQPKKKKQYRPVVPKIFHSGYDVYLQRRAKNEINLAKGTGEVDLAVFSLDEVVEQCFNNRLIPMDIYTRFMNLSGTKQILKDFLECWTEENMHKYNFRNTPFTLVDHRRLSELLLHFFPSRYTINTIDAFHVDEKEVLTKVYFISAESYVRLYLTLDSISGCSWWQDIKGRYKDTEHANYFTIKQSLTEPINPLHLCQSLQIRSRYLTETLGVLHLQDNEAELEKILSNKFKNPQPFNKGYYGEESSAMGERSEMMDQTEDGDFSGGANMQSSRRAYRQEETNNEIYQEEEDDNE